jgi:tetratricopeptide (TPR) repeat protein
VALKVLPFAAALDARQLQRFKNEAQAAAVLHHTHIVPVFGIGCERGVHYYAMQLIDGQSLAQVISDQKQSGGSSAALASTPSPAARATEPDIPNPTPFHTAARLAMQAAHALEYAHQLGIVHRDVKPANLLLDGRGDLWVTDFGLAHCRNQAALTMAGDLVGTLRYMSPEQALGLPGGMDPRTDLYSLGATLYELLTFQPAFPGTERQELLRQIGDTEPRAVRQLNKAVPAELETIVLKAMARNPAERYATAGELADDLQRFLNDEPIRARRPALVQQARRWARRHQPTVWSAAVALLGTLTVLAACVGWVVRDRAAQQARTAAVVEAAVQEARQFQREGNWPRAQAAADRAAALLAGADSPELRQSVGNLLADFRMVVWVEDVRLLRTGLRDGHFDVATADGAYESAFRDYGIDVAAQDPGEAAARIAARSIRAELAAALDGWAEIRRGLAHPGGLSWQKLLAIARQADSDPQRAALRDAVLRGDRQRLVERAAYLAKQANDDEIRELSPVTLMLLAESLRVLGALDDATALLRRAQPQHSGDFWINHMLGAYLDWMRPPQSDEALRYYTAAVALRPESPGARLNLGNALAAKGRHDDALAAYHAAIALKPDYAEAHCNLGIVLEKQGRHDEAVVAYRKALAWKPDLVEAHTNLGIALQKEERVDEAIALFRRAIALRPSCAEAYCNLGSALLQVGRLEEALTACRQALLRNHDYPEAFNNLGLAFQRRGQLRQAVAAYRRAIDLKPELPQAHFNLGLVFGEQGRLDEALATFRRMLALEPNSAEAYTNIGHLLARKGQTDGAAAAFRRAVALDPRLVTAHFNLGIILADQGNLNEAAAEYERVLRLEPRHAAAHYDLGNALKELNRLEEAVTAYRQAIALKPDYAEAYCNLAGALRQHGKFTEALAAAKRGHDLGSRRPDWSYPSAQWVREYQQLSDLVGRLPAVLRGTVQPADADERRAYALLCTDQKRYLAAARLRASVLAADPKQAGDLQAGYRYDAACAAARAAAGQGADNGDLDESERVRWRKQSVQWLRTDLMAWDKHLAGRQPRDRQRVVQRLQGWRGDPDLASLRDPAAVARLPADEQQACRQLWAEVQALLTRAQMPE